MRDRDLRRFSLPIKKWFTLLPIDCVANWKFLSLPYSDKYELNFI